MKPLLILLLLHYAHSRPTFDNPPPNTTNYIKMSPSKEIEINTILAKLSDFINKIIDEHEKISIPYINISIEGFSGDESDETETNLQVFVNDCDDIDDDTKDNDLIEPIQQVLTGKTNVGNKQTIGANKTIELTDKALKKISHNETSYENVDKDKTYNKLWKVKFMRDIENLLDDTVSDIRFIGDYDDNERKAEISLQESSSTITENKQELNSGNSTTDDEEKDTERHRSNDINNKFKKVEFITSEEDAEMNERKQRNIKILNEIDEYSVTTDINSNTDVNYNSNSDSDNDDTDDDCILDEDEMDAFKKTDENDQTEQKKLNNTTIILDTNSIVNNDFNSKVDSHKENFDEEWSDELEDGNRIGTEDNIADVIVNDTQILKDFEEQNNRDVFNVTKLQNKNNSSYFDLVENSANNVNVNEKNENTDYDDVSQIQRSITTEKAKENDFSDYSAGQTVAEVMTLTLEENGEEMLRMIEKKRDSNIPLLVYVQETKGREEYVFLNKK